MTPLANQPAFPVVNPGGGIVAKGLTAREYYAGLTMQAILSNLDGRATVNDIARGAVEFADALLAELEKSK